MAACLVAVEASKASRRTRGWPWPRLPASSATTDHRLVEARCDIVATSHADVAELVDARRSGRRVRKDVEVRVLSSAFRKCWQSGTFGESHGYTTKFGLETVRSVYSPDIREFITLAGDIPGSSGDRHRP